MNSSFEYDNPEREQTDLVGVEKINALNEISSRIVSKRPDKSLILANEALKLSQVSEYSRGYIESLINLAQCYKQLGKPEDSLPLLIQALEKSRETGKTDKECVLLNKIALLYKLTGDYASSADYYYKALKATEETGDEELKGKILNNLANLYCSWDKFDKAEEYHLKLLSIREKNGPSEELAHTFNNLGNLYFKLKQHEKSLAFNQKALEIKNIYGDKQSIANTLSNIARNHLQLFFEKGEEKHLEKAKENLSEVLKIRRDSKNAQGLASAYIDLARLHFAMKETKGALANLEKSKKIASEGNMKTILLDVYREFSEIFEKCGDYENALKYNKLYSNLRNEIFSEESNRRAIELHAKYEKEKIEKQNEIMRLKIEANEKLESLVEQRTHELKMEIERRIKSEDEILKFKTLTDEAAYGAAISDSSGKIIYVNKSLENMTGWSAQELLGRDLTVLQPSDSDFSTEKIISVLTLSNSAFTSEITAVRKDGTTFPALINPGLIRDPQGNTLYLQSSVIDITERKKMEAQLRQNQKMLAIGTMASGIAHDFNNILGSISTFAESAKKELPENSTAQPMVENILNTISRAKEFVKEILLFSRDREKELKPVNISELVEETARLLAKSLPEKIKSIIEIEKTSCKILSDPSHVNQILLNLFENAKFAMREKGGTITVKLKEECLDKILLSLSDTGEGMDKPTLDRIFEPYFTTKREGEGSGIGLAIVHGLVKKSGGDITVYSEPGRGTVFNIYFKTLSPVKFSKKEKTSLPMTGNERILFVDDEALFAETIEEILKRIGYRITAVNRAEEALLIFSQDPEGFDLLIADYTMPGISGPELAQKIREVRPDIPVLFCSGLLNAEKEDSVQSIPRARVITKPVPVNELAAAIRRILEEE